ncbi:transposable element Tc1 transposase [Trichonephila clavipes]|nr:transposable element Tc1 transposase [Trichonephila clavipes]
MPPLRNKKSQKPMELKRRRLIGRREGGFSYRATVARVQQNSSTVMRAWKLWTEEYRTTRRTGSGRRKVMSARDDLHLLRMAVNERTAFSRQLAARSSAATNVLMSASSIHRRLIHRGLRAWEPLYRILLTANLRQLRLQWAHQHKAWQVDWH